jgi:septum formation inhibitor MinC
LDAELVSIAGYYLTKEDMQRFAKDTGVKQIYLENEQIHITAL